MSDWTPYGRFQGGVGGKKPTKSAWKSCINNIDHQKTITNLREKNVYVILKGMLAFQHEELEALQYR